VPPGTPVRDPPPGAPRPGAPARENFPGGPGGGPGGPPRGGPPGAPRDPPPGPHFGPVLGVYIYILRSYTGGPAGGALWAPQGGPPRGGPRGAKKCTFFWVFNNSPSRDSLGPFFGPPRDPPRTGYSVGPPMGSVIKGPRRCYGTMRSMRCRAGPLGRRASGGYPLAGLTANGGHVPSGRGPPSKQGRKSAQDREVAGRRRPFARAKRGPTTGVTGKVRKCLAEHIRPSENLVGSPLKPSVRTSAFGHGRAKRSADRTWGTSRSDCRTPTSLKPPRPPTFNNY